MWWRVRNGGCDCVGLDQNLGMTASSMADAPRTMSRSNGGSRAKMRNRLRNARGYSTAYEETKGSLRGYEKLVRMRSRFSLGITPCHHQLAPGDCLTRLVEEVVHVTVSHGRREEWGV